MTIKVTFEKRPVELHHEIKIVDSDNRVLFQSTLGQLVLMRIVDEKIILTESVYRQIFPEIEYEDDYGN